MFKKFKRQMSIFLSIIMLLGIVSPVYAESLDGEKTVDIITINDFHGAVTEQIGRTPGMARIVGRAKEIKEENPNTIFVSGGDSYQGTAISNLKYGDPVSDMFRLMDLELSALGNHEFDWGLEHIERWKQDGEVEFLAANVKDEASGEIMPGVKPYEIIERDGVKIAFIGLATEETATSTKKENIEGLVFTDPVEEAKIWVEYLKAGKDNKGTPDVIVALTHLASDQKDGIVDPAKKDSEGNTLAPALADVEGLDAIISGHSHRRVSGKVNGVPIIQAGNNGYNFGKLSIKLDKDKNILDISTELENLRDKIEKLPVDKEAKEIYDKYEKETEKVLGEVIGKATGTFEHDSRNNNVTPLGRWTSEVMRDHAGVQITIQNGGGLRTSLPEGDITVGKLYEIMPFDNFLVKMKLPGKDVKKAIEHGLYNPNVGNGQFVGLYVEFDPDAPFHNRISKITLENGEELKDDEYYSVVTNDFLSTGGDGYDFGNAKDVEYIGDSIRDVLIDAVKEAGSISPQEVDYLVEKEASQVIKPEFNKEDHKAYIYGDGEGNINAYNEITREEVAVIVDRLLSDEYKATIEDKEIKFEDVVDGRWSTDSIYRLANAGLMIGSEPGKFKPSDKITRGEVVKILSAFSELESGEDKFEDAKDHWAREEIAIALAEGWIKGYTDGSFKPSNNISRVEFIIIMNRVLDRNASLENMLDGRVEFKDLDKDAWFYEAIQEAVTSHEYERLEDGSEKWTNILKAS